MKNQQDVQNFGYWLRQLREKAGFTQDGLAFEAGIAKRTVQKIEAGEQAATVDLLFSLARALQMQPAEIFKGFVIEMEE